MCVKAKEGLAGYGKEQQQEEIQPDDGKNEGNIKSEQSEGICTVVSCFFKHLPTPFSVTDTNSDSGISYKFKVFQQANVVILYSIVTNERE